MIKLTKLAKDLGVHRLTLYKWKKDGKLDFIRSEAGSINYVSIETYNRLMGIKESKEEMVVIYCRVSSPSSKNDLETQKQRMISYCNARGYRVHRVIEEVASGLNDYRPKLQTLFKKGDFTKLVVEHKDRLTRSGFGYIETLLQASGKQIEVVNNVEGDKQDLVQDFVSIITSYCARLYGQRRSKRKVLKLVTELEKDQDTNENLSADDESKELG